MKKSKNEILLNGLSDDKKPIGIDYNKIRDDLKIEIEKWEALVKKEDLRISDLYCPLCKSKNKESINITKNNGIIGPGYHSKLLDSYYCCKSCGIMYKDIAKKDLPERPKSFFMNH